MTKGIRRAVWVGAIVVAWLGVAHVVDRVFHASQPGSTVELRQPDALAPGDDQEGQRRQGPPPTPSLVNATPTGVNTQRVPSGERVWVRESDGSVWALPIRAPKERAALPQAEPSAPGPSVALVLFTLVAVLMSAFSPACRAALVRR